MTTLNHWGKWINKHQPITGVVSIHTVEWINDEVSGGNAIDLTWELYRAQWHAEKLAGFQHRYGYDRTPSKSTLRRWEDQFAGESEFYEPSEPCHLIGQWIKVEDGNYIPDPAGEYSAIASYDAFMAIQVVRSQYARRAALCSPCFPGQADLDHVGNWLAYDLPPELYGNGLYKTNPNAPFGLGRISTGKIMVKVAYDVDSGALVARTNCYSDFADHYTHKIELYHGDSIAAMLADAGIERAWYSRLQAGYFANLFLPETYLDLITDQL